LAEHPVKHDVDQAQTTDKRLLPEVGDADDRQYSVDGDEQDGAERRTPYGPAATEDRHAADDHGSHGLELDGKKGKTAAESLALFGQPLSDAQVETLADGQQYIVQWFERARFESHGDQGVLLGLLSNDLAAARGWRR